MTALLPAGRQVPQAVQPVHNILGDYRALEPAWNGIKDQQVQDVFATAGKLTNATQG